MRKLNILITAGPTRESIDPVRFISNRSSGKMGYSLAEAAANLGNDVSLISGPVNIAPPEGVTLINIESAEELACEVRKSAETADIIFMVAAVADYRPKNVAENKIKKTNSDMVLELERTTDILAELGGTRSEIRDPGSSPHAPCSMLHAPLLIGFAAETENVIENSKIKLEKKNVDWIIANDVSRSDAGLGSDNNAVTMISKDGEVIELPLQSKKELAAKILEIIFNWGI
jgi:phosphopantothenoylcysteine decarboxylase/phosphopantothenate--cysteine ligase